MKKNLIIIGILFLWLQSFSQVDWDLFDKAYKLQNNGDYSNAIREYQNILKTDSMVAGCWYNIGECYSAQEQFDNALKNYYKALRIRPNDSIIHYTIGLTYSKMHEWKASISFLKNAIDLNYIPNVEIYFQIGSNYLFINKLDSAKKYLIKAYNIDSNNLLVLTNLAYCYLNDLPNKSCEYFNKAYQIDSLNYQTINNLGYSYYLCDSLNKSIFFFEKSKLLNPDNSYVYRNIGLYYMKKNNKTKACENLELAIKKNFIKQWGEKAIIELINYCND